MKILWIVVVVDDNDVKAVLDLEKDIFTDLLLIFDSEFQFFWQFESASNSRRSIDLIEYSQQIVQHVTSPLKALINSFTGPNKLIHKRYDKLLDYEAALSDLELKSSNQSTGGTNSFSANVWTRHPPTKIIPYFCSPLYLLLIYWEFDFVLQKVDEQLGSSTKNLRGHEFSAHRRVARVDSPISQDLFSERAQFRHHH